MSCLVEFSMSPLDKGASVGDYVARCLEVVAASGLPYQFHAMGTILEGEWSQCMQVIEQCYERLGSDCARVTCAIKIDARQGDSGRLASKVQRVEKRLGRKLTT
ncbi:MAG TPA: MTH1187 family thiamine-binding protein [Phycisphaerae bacterium]|nr:MTH1187 family thiamine-binding protein [Phycisphaerae bacterium]